MITPELKEYINSQKQLGVSIDIIRSALSSQGWSGEDLDQALNTLTTDSKLVASPMLRRRSHLNKKVLLVVSSFILILAIGGTLVFLRHRNNSTNSNRVAISVKHQAPASTSTVGNVTVNYIVLPKLVNNSFPYAYVGNGNYIYKTVDNEIIYNGQTVGESNEFYDFALSPSGSSYLTTQNTYSNDPIGLPTKITVFVNNQPKYSLQKDNAPYLTTSIFAVTDAGGIFEYRAISEDNNPILFNNSQVASSGKIKVFKLFASSSEQNYSYSGTIANQADFGDYVVIGNKQYKLDNQQTIRSLTFTKDLSHFATITQSSHGSEKITHYIVDGIEVASSAGSAQDYHSPLIALSANASVAYYDTANNAIKTAGASYSIKDGFHVGLLKLSPDGKSVFYTQYQRPVDSRAVTSSSAYLNSEAMHNPYQDKKIINAEFIDNNTLDIYLAP